MKNKKDGIENRSKFFFGSGHVLSIAVVIIFLTLYFTIAASAAFWKETLFNGLPTLSQSCSYQFDSDKSQMFTKITLPRGPISFLDNHKGHLNSVKPSRLIYKCQIPQVGSRSMSIAHFGWFVGENTSIEVDGKLTTRFSGIEKLSFPVVGNETVVITTDFNTVKSQPVGFVGLQPPVIASGRRINNLIYGLETLLTITRTINTVLPFLSLGLVLALAWFAGIRSRIVTITLHMLFCLTVYKSFQFLPNLSDNLSFLTRSGGVLRAFYEFSFLFFLMEYFRVIPKMIYPLCRISLVFTTCYIITAYLEVDIRITERFLQAYPLILGSAIALILANYMNKGRKQNNFGWSVLVLTSLCTMYLTQYFLWQNKYYHINLLGIIEVFVPLVTALFLLTQFSRSNLLLIQEKKTTQFLTDKFEVEETRKKMLAKFLPQFIVQRFDNAEDIEHQITDLLQPQEKNVAIIQADLRGFSELTENSEPKELAALLRRCFAPVVDQFQNVAVIKLIGDCLFAFVESPEGEKTQCDTCIEIALNLLHNLDEVNSQREESKKLKFGIGINYGPAIVGNLSAEDCIDYTVIGETVNITARLEELTKKKAIEEMIGINGIILGESVVWNLGTYKQLNCIPFRIEKGLRSIEHVKEAAYVQYSELKLLDKVSQKSAA